MMRSFLLCSLLLPASSIACSQPDEGGDRDVRMTSLGESATPAEDEDQDEDDGNEVLVAASEIPELVRAAALARVPGLQIDEAEKELADGEVVYCVHGTLEGVFYEVEVAADDGEILEVEVGGDDEDDD